MGKIHFGLFFGYYILTIMIVVYYVYMCMDPISPLTSEPVSMKCNT